MRSPQPFALVVAVATLGVLPATAPAGVIYNTFGPGNTFGAGFTQISSPESYTPDPSYGIYGQGFFTPNQPTLLSRVVVPFRMDDPANHVAPPILAIYTSEFQDYGGGNFEYYPLADRVADLSQRTILSGGVPGQPTVFAYTSPSPVVLQPNTFYYLVAMVVSDPDTEANNVWFDSAFNHEYFQTLFTGYSPLDFDNDKYGAITIYSPGRSGPGSAMRVEVTDTPEPTTLAVFGLLAVGGLIARRR